MWVCKDCKHEFDEPKKVKEWHEAYGGRCYETFIYCPKCDSENITDTPDDDEFDDFGEEGERDV